MRGSWCRCNAVLAWVLALVLACQLAGRTARLQIGGDTAVEQMGFNRCSIYSPFRVFRHPFGVI